VVVLAGAVVIVVVGVVIAGAVVAVVGVVLAGVVGVVDAGVVVVSRNLQMGLESSERVPSGSSLNSNLPENSKHPGGASLRYLSCTSEV